ncbi:cation diffusion facilitator family transporter [Allostreptomyces psammosilenae]|uniref:Cation diffusion facilitator family transporter n=1 Tax=Allostreptomyces psammosilenae TaxID=1892865 RepID=A0A852ZZF8_9ACTN|nr:cation diffusion facilitator family transporter [Allostreptomyces psammosilenae]NYI07763.1 cation diffusion facilitator family transporter [Allostreptomyces psammosilenae]
MEDPHAPPAPRPPGGGDTVHTRRTVLVALAANLAIACAKVVGGLVSGSPAMLSEAAHSVADSLNEVFLLTSLTRSRRRPDARHPFGYGKERFFWSLLAAVGIFVMGGCFSFYQGLNALRAPQAEPHGGYAVALVVLLVSLGAEGISLTRALFQVRRHAAASGRRFSKELRHGDEPALRTVLAEDATAVLGVLLAMGGIGLHLLTGAAAWEAAASLGIALLLMYVAYRLGRNARDELVGEAAAPALRQAVADFLERQPEIDAVTALLTMRLGPDTILLAARVDLEPGLESEHVEEAAVRIKHELAERWPALEQIFLDITEATRADRGRALRERRELDRMVADAERDRRPRGARPEP